MLVRQKQAIWSHHLWPNETVTGTFHWEKEKQCYLSDILKETSSYQNWKFLWNLKVRQIIQKKNKSQGKLVLSTLVTKNGGIGTSVKLHVGLEVITWQHTFRKWPCTGQTPQLGSRGFLFAHIWVYWTVALHGTPNTASTILCPFCICRTAVTLL